MTIGLLRVCFWSLKSETKVKEYSLRLRRLYGGILAKYSRSLANTICQKAFSSLTGNAEMLLVHMCFQSQKAVWRKRTLHCEGISPVSNKQILPEPLPFVHSQLSWQAGLKQEGYRAKLGVVPLQQENKTCIDMSSKLDDRLSFLLFNHVFTNHRMSIWFN